MATHRTTCLKFEVWPKEVQLAWDEIVRGDDPFDEPGQGAHWSLSTCLMLCMLYGRWLSFLATTGRLETGSTPASWVTPAAVSTFLASLEGLADHTVLTQLEGLLTMSRAMAPDDDWAWLRDVINGLRRRGPRGRSKHARLRESAELFEAGLALMEAAEQEKTPSLRAARFRNGLLEAMLAARPLRLRNATMIDLGRHLVRAGTGWMILFEGEETKTHRPIELPWPEQLNAPLERYLDRHRPVLLGGRTSNRLWISRWGAPMTGKTIHAQIVTITKRQFGRSLNPHLFRDCFTTSVAIHDPEHIGGAPILLGHSQRTSQKHYNQAQALEAGRLYQQSVLALRRQLAPASPQGSPALSRSRKLLLSPRMTAAAR